MEVIKTEKNRTHRGWNRQDADEYFAAMGAEEVRELTIATRPSRWSGIPVQRHGAGIFHYFNSSGRELGYFIPDLMATVMFENPREWDAKMKEETMPKAFHQRIFVKGIA